MPHGAHHGDVLEAVRPRGDQAIAGLAISRCRDAAVVVGEIGRIMTLAEAGRMFDAREACAALLFDYQPVLAAHPMLLQRFAGVLQRCKAEQLLRRLSVAVHGELV